jgi:polysaccharide export outer membrane protein
MTTANLGSVTLRSGTSISSVHKRVATGSARDHRTQPSAAWPGAMMAIQSIAIAGAFALSAGAFLPGRDGAHAVEPLAHPALVYKLGPQDRVRLRVFEWRPSRDEFFEWKALNAEFTVGASGFVSLPLVGEIPANGETSSQLAQSIGSKLQERMGLVSIPDISVEVSQFRPFYITGYVSRPGEYPYRPGLTVLQALTIGGGLKSHHDGGVPRFERESVVTRGELDLYAKEFNALLVRRARLEAELKSDTGFELPAILVAHQDDRAVQTLIDQEQLQFETRSRVITTQLKALGELRGYLQREVESLSGQLGKHDMVMQTVQNELNSVQTLAVKGLATAPRRLALERNIAQFEGDRLRLETGLAKARQDISRTEISVIELKNRRVSEITSELQQVQAKIEQIELRFETAQKLLYESEILAPLSHAHRIRNDAAKPNFKIVRGRNGSFAEFLASETTVVEPGDTIKVELPEINLGQGLQAVSVTLPTLPSVTSSAAKKIGKTAAPAAAVPTSRRQVHISVRAGEAVKRLDQ